MKKGIWKDLCAVKKFIMPVYILIALALFNVQYIDRIPLLNFVVNVIRVVLFIAFLPKAGRILKTNPAFLCLIGIVLIEMISTIFFGGTVISIAIRYLNILLAVLWISLYKNEFDLIFPSIFISASFLIIVNTISMIQFPHGMYIDTYNARGWIIGQKQEFCHVFIIAVVLGVIFWKKNRYRLLTMIDICMIVYSMLVTMTLGLIIYFAIFVITLICLNIFRKEIKAVTLVNINMIGMVLLIIFIYTTPRFSSIFSILDRIQGSNSLTKADTLLSRIGIWHAAINIFLSSPIFGRGLITADAWSTIGCYSRYHSDFHNIYLDMLASGGIVCFGLYIAMLYLVAIKMDNNKSPLRKIFMASIFALNILRLSECVYFCFAFGLYFFGYYISDVKFANKKLCYSEGSANNY